LRSGEINPPFSGEINPPFSGDYPGKIYEKPVFSATVYFFRNCLFLKVNRFEKILYWKFKISYTFL